jgi:hypothetical protein
MENIQIFTITNPLDQTTVEWVKIDRGNGEYTSMPKAVWDEQQKAAEESGTL